MGLRVDRLLVGRAHVGSLGDRLREAVWRQQLQTERLTERLEDALAVADRHSCVARPDPGDHLVVLGEALGLELGALLIEVRAVLRVQLLVVGDDLTDHPLH